MAERVRRCALMLVATWPRQLAFVVLSWLPLRWLLDDVLNGATWTIIVAAFAWGIAVAHAIPEPVKIRERLKGAPHGRGE